MALQQLRGLWLIRALLQTLLYDVECLQELCILCRPLHQAGVNACFSSLQLGARDVFGCRVGVQWRTPGNNYTAWLCCCVTAAAGGSCLGAEVAWVKQEQ